jgi:hypothetical protein
LHQFVLQFSDAGFEPLDFGLSVYPCSSLLGDLASNAAISYEKSIVTALSQHCHTVYQLAYRASWHYFIIVAEHVARFGKVHCKSQN